MFAVHVRLEMEKNQMNSNNKTNVHSAHELFAFVLPDRPIERTYYGDGTKHILLLFYSLTNCAMKQGHHNYILHKLHISIIFTI